MKFNNKNAMVDSTSGEMTKEDYAERKQILENDLKKK